MRLVLALVPLGSLQQEGLTTVTSALSHSLEPVILELERQLLLAGDVAGVALGSALTTGQQPGGTVIALDPEFQKVTGFAGFDNFAPDDLGAL